MSKIKLIIIFLLIVILAGVALYYFLSTENEKEEKVYNVGILSGAEAFADIADGFKKGMEELGYIENKDIIYNIRRFNGDPEGEKQAVKEFMEGKADLIFAFPTDTAIIAKEISEGTGIPIVFALAGIEGNNLVESVQRPGGLVTGVRFNGPDNTLKRLEILLEIKPESKRVGVFYDVNYPNARPSLEMLRSIVSSLGITLVEDAFADMQGLKAALEARSELDDIGIDAILIMPEVLSQTPEGFQAISEFADEYKLPIGGGMAYTADRGAVFSYIADNIEMGKLAAPMADKIFKGTAAGTISLITPEAKLRLNYNKIQELGLEVPESLMTIADEIIK